jgi:hypothetical protein
MSDIEHIPFDADVATLAAWLSRRFANVPDALKISDLFENFGRRGQRRQPWLDVLSLKVRALRDEDMSWDAATRRALDEWDEHDVPLPHVWRQRSDRSLENLVRQLKRRKESVLDLGIDQVTAEHFWKAIVCREFTIAARLHHAAGPRPKRDIQSQLREMSVTTKHKESLL